jgi:magnesium-transporting ATPase (P-type)
MKWKPGFKPLLFKLNLYRYIPEHKYIVEALRQQGFLAGMTGDGVNDAPVGLYKLISVYP